MLVLCRPDLKCSPFPLAVVLISAGEREVRQTEGEGETERKGEREGGRDGERERGNF